MSNLIRRGSYAGALLAVLGACTQPPSNTDLNTAGPPMVRQVLMNENYINTQGSVIPYAAPQLAFGTHPDPALNDDSNQDHKVQRAIVDPNNQLIRVIMDELLVGNSMEMIACRTQVQVGGQVGAERYSRVPLGTTPDDIENCSGPQDLVQARCHGDHAVCINMTGKPQVSDLTPNPTIAPGDPSGIQDANDDGAADSNLFIEGSVRIVCSGNGRTFEAPLNTSGSYWQPSGNQLVPAHGGVNALGPAVVMRLALGLPTSATCSIKFDPTVTDKEGHPVCASPDGDIDQPCPGGDDGNDTSLVTFGTDALRLDKKNPVDASMNNDVAEVITLQFNTAMSLSSLASEVSITEGGAPLAFTPQRSSEVLINQLIVTGQGQVCTQDTDCRSGTCRPQNTGPKLCAGLKKNTAYVVTINPTVTDFAGQPLGGQPISFSFKTAP
jgi:Bacterial Ig-like domain